jgi:hypothetical protein
MPFIQNIPGPLSHEGKSKGREIIVKSALDPKATVRAWSVIFSLHTPLT